MIASAASEPLFGFFFFDKLLLWTACLKFKAVIMPFPMGLLKLTERFKIELNVEKHIKSKWGVWPLITQPSAIKPSYLFIFFLIAIGI